MLFVILEALLCIDMILFSLPYYIVQFCLNETRKDGSEILSVVNCFSDYFFLKVISWFTKQINLVKCFEVMLSLFFCGIKRKVEIS